MCGIAAFFAKTPACESRLGELFTPMMSCLSGRGPDSAGVAIYREPTVEGYVKIVAQHPDLKFDWLGNFLERLTAAFGSVASHRIISTHCVMVVPGSEDAVRPWIEAECPEVTLMSAGALIEIYKEIGLPSSVLDRFVLGAAQGSHAIGHTRMATESAVTTAGSHPFSTGSDLCLVHNGSLSNHNRLRLNLRREGISFRTDNDSEVAAGYLTWRLRQGDSLEHALESALKNLDGFFTFAVGTRDGFAVLRDPIACKPAVMAETSDYVVMASEYRAFAHLPGIADATVWEPEPGRVYTWSKMTTLRQIAA